MLISLRHNHKSIQLFIESNGNSTEIYLRNQYHHIVNNVTFPEVESDHCTLITVIPESLIISQTRKAEIERTGIVRCTVY